MATIKISELEEVTELSNSDFLPIVNDNETKKVSLEQLDEMLTGGGIPEYVAEFGFNYNSSSVWWSTSGDAGSAIQAALQKALDNGEKYFKLIFRNTASGPPVLETYMYYNSSSNTLSQRQQYSVYTSSYTNEKMIYSHYVGSITDGVVGNGSTGYIWSLMTDYVPYTTTAYVDDSVSKKQDILTAGDNITIVDNVISSTGGGASVDLSNYYTKDEVDVLMDDIAPGANIYVAKDVYSGTTSSPLNISATSTGGQNIIAAAQRAYDNGDYIFRLRMCATDAKLIPEYIDTVWTLPESGSGTITETAIRRYVFSNLTANTLRYYYFSKTGIKMTDGKVVSSGTYIGGIFYKEETNITGTNLANYNYVTTSDMNTALATKQPLLTAGDNITIDENNVISASGGSSESSVPMFSWDFNSTDATVVTMFQEWWDLFKTSSVMYPISNVSNSGSIYEGDYWFPYMEARLSSNTSITITFINIKGNNTVYMPKPTIQYKLVTIKFGDTLANNGTVSSITVDSTWSHSPLVSYNPSGSYAQQQMDSSALSLTNTYEYTPTSDYHPTTKKYVDDAITNAVSSVLEAEY